MAQEKKAPSIRIIPATGDVEEIIKKTKESFAGWGYEPFVNSGEGAPEPVARVVVLKDDSGQVLLYVLNSEGDIIVQGKDPSDVATNTAEFLLEEAVFKQHTKAKR